MKLSILREAVREAESAPPDGKGWTRHQELCGREKEENKVGIGGRGEEDRCVLEIAGTNRNHAALGVPAKALGKTYI